MRNLLKLVFLLLVVFFLPFKIVACTDACEAKKIKDIIYRVNRHWQTNNPPETSPFWHNAVYHTGNMEVYFLTGNEPFLAYSEKWAEYNEWKGAKNNNKAEWKYAPYSISDDFVLFGDYQVCFQTYIDLYNIAPDSIKISRTIEVMEYQINTPNIDYIWWSDGLYMIMPILTKLYQLTYNPKYLEKLYEYVCYSDSIMYDIETGLYFRDAKYVYPEHKSVNGKKDIWARGSGWVLAGLAKVLKDLPTDYEYYSFFADKFKKMALSVAELQQPDGYWTRSMMDPGHAPGPETSGTAFFTYGILWGVNNGFLEKNKYAPIIDKAWSFLENKALQPDGRIGYVQPIGEKAIQGQVVDVNSSANFGVGAFLLAACEYYRYLTSPQNF